MSYSCCGNIGDMLCFVSDSKDRSVQCVTETEFKVLISEPAFNKQFRQRTIKSSEVVHENGDFFCSDGMFTIWLEWAYKQNVQINVSIGAVHEDYKCWLSNDNTEYRVKDVYGDLSCYFSHPRQSSGNYAPKC